MTSTQLSVVLSSVACFGRCLNKLAVFRSNESAMNKADNEEIILERQLSAVLENNEGTISRKGKASCAATTDASWKSRSSSARAGHEREASDPDGCQLASSSALLGTCETSARETCRRLVSSNMRTRSTCGSITDICQSTACSDPSAHGVRPCRARLRRRVCVDTDECADE